MITQIKFVHTNFSSYSEQTDYLFMLEKFVGICNRRETTDMLEVTIGMAFTNTKRTVALHYWNYGWLRTGLQITYKDIVVLFVECDTSKIYDDVEI